ncbi:MAG: hypothetical protein JO193_03735 [Candidatus Eremiobacteraeota bacterium]|nr:hypothetical protein [Candidatus Eremiobacteraeota bacterium]
METRLVQLLGSFIGVTADYALARLELAYRHPARLVPPTIDRLNDASAQTLRTHWETVEAQLEAAMRYVKQIEALSSTPIRSDVAFGWLERSVRELDQYARAVRWVLTVSEREDHETRGEA